MNKLTIFYLKNERNVEVLVNYIVKGVMNEGLWYCFNKATVNHVTYREAVDF